MNASQLAELLAKEYMHNALLDYAFDPKGRDDLKLKYGVENDYLLTAMFEYYARAVLAEAERALRERAKQLDAAPITADYLLGEANGWFEAADLLAGMRRP